MKQLSHIIFSCLENNVLQEILKLKFNYVCKNCIIQEYNSLRKNGKLQKSLLLYLAKHFIIGEIFLRNS